MLSVDLVYNLSLLAALSVISGFLGERLKHNWTGSVLQGFLFGAVAVIGMLRPLNLGPGLIFDGRSVMLSLCGLFYGPVAAAIAGAMTIILRLYQGGVGATMGVLVILASLFTGIVFYYRYTHRSRRISGLTLYGFGIIVHLAMIAMMSFLPSALAVKTFRTVALPVIVIYPLATVLIGKIISDAITRTQFMETLKKSEYALRTSELKIRTIFNTIPDLLWLKDTQGVYLACNAMFERYVGASEHEITGKRDNDFFDAKSSDFYRENDRRTIISGKKTVYEEWITFADSGKRALMETVKTPLYDDSGTLTGILGMKHDITERTETENRIKALLAEKELLLQEVHHRIKNNMNTIKGLLTLQLYATDNPVVSASLKDAENRIESIMMLYDRLYCTDNYQELSVKSYLEPLAAEIINSFPNSTMVTLKTDITDFILKVQLLTSLGIITNEILTNSMKHAFAGREHGHIGIAIHSDNGTVRLTIEDDGIGIGEDFDLEKPEGFGLQLVNMIVSQIGATISLQKSPGTRYTVLFSTTQ